MNEEETKQDNLGETNFRDADGVQPVTTDGAQFDGPTPRTNFALNTLLLLQAAATLRKGDVALDKTEAQCSASTPATVSPAEEGCLPTVPTDSTFDDRSEQPVHSDSTRLSEISAVAINKSCERVVVACDSRRAGTSANEDVNSCARTSPCTKTIKESLHQRIRHPEVSVKSPVEFKKNIPVFDSVIQESCIIPNDANTSASKMEKGAPSRASSVMIPTLQPFPPQFFPFQNLVFASCDRVNVSTKSITTPVCVRSPVQAWDQRMNTQVVSSLSGRNFQVGQIKTAACADLKSPSTSSKQLQSPSCKGTAIVVSGKQSVTVQAQHVPLSPMKCDINKGMRLAATYTVPAVRYFTVRQQLINSRSPVSYVMSPVGKAYPEKTTSERPVLIKKGNTNPSARQTAGLHIPKKPDFSYVIPPMGCRPTDSPSPSDGKWCPSESKSQSQSPGSRTDTRKIFPPLSSPQTNGIVQAQVRQGSPLTSPVTPSTSGRVACTLAPGPSNKPFQSPGKQTMPLSSDMGVNPTLSKMMKHFNYTMTNLDQFIDNRFLRKLLSSDLCDVDDLFEDVERSERMQQHPIPKLVLEFIFESDDREKRNQQIKKRMHSEELSKGTVFGKCTCIVTTCSPKQGGLSEAGKPVKGKNEVCFPAGGNADEKPPHAETDVEAPRETLNQSRNACNDTQNHPQATIWNSNFRKERNCCMSNNLPQKTSSVGSHRTGSTRPKQIGVKVSETENIHMGCLDLIPDRVMWNLHCRLFPPWKKTHLYADGGGVDEFFRKCLDPVGIFPSHDQRNTAAREQGNTSRSGKKHQNAKCLKTELMDNKFGDGEPVTCREPKTSTKTKRKRSKHRKEKKRKEKKVRMQEKRRNEANKPTGNETTSETVMHSEIMFKSRESKKRTSKRKHEVDESYSTKTTSRQVKTKSGEEKRIKHRKRKMDEKRTRKEFVHQLHLSEEVSHDNLDELSSEKNPSRQTSGNEQGQTDRESLKRCKSTAVECSAEKRETCSKFMPPKWKLKVILKSPRSKTKGRRKTQRNKTKPTNV